MAKRHPLEIGRFHELRHTLGQMRLSDLAVGSDGRNRVMLSPFATKTSRNAPSTSRFVFGPSTWLRSLIRPKQGRAVAYVDWKQQEFGIAGALSQDSNMVEAYASGDPYLAFAIQSGSVPPTATKQTHGAQRALFKICVLAVAYGQTEWGLAHAINKSPVHARELLRLHQRTYPKFYQWSQRAVDSAILNGEIQSVFGWKLRVGQDTKPRTLQNFPAQSNGAEMMRIAAILLHQAGIQVCAPIHDAFLVEGPADEIQDVVETARSCMRRASEIVLDGFPLDTDFEVVTYPDRYSDERGETMWKAVSELIDNPAPCEPIGD
jgi:DNA polymerase I-like protein with 3'-5' exonuclease and polymerase domains